MGATNLVIPEKDSAEGYEQEIDIHNDGVGAAGFYPQHPLNPSDLLAGVERDASDNLVLKDPVAGSHTLLSLLSGGAMPPASAVGQVLMSVDGSIFSAQQPLTAPDHGSAGWLVADDGILLVTG